jgi:hypothetical protein
MGRWLWPVHPQPLDDEVLSSWMIRLARENGFKVHSFYAQQFGRAREIWTRDIDHHAPPWLLGPLASHAGLNSDRLFNMTLRAFESIVFERFNEFGITRFVMPLSVFHRVRRGYGQQFCPICLEEDEIPYLRRRWRLSLFVLCTHHLVLLHDRCASCQRPFAPHRADMSSRRSFPAKHSMRLCAFCGARMATNIVAADAADIAMQQRIGQVIADGYAAVNDRTVVYSHLFFAGLRMLISGRSRVEHLHERGVLFERAPVATRLLQLRTATELLAEWPDQFLAYCSRIPSPYSMFVRDVDEMPYWIGAVLRQHVFQGRAVISKTEAKAIVESVERRSTAGLSALTRRFSGRDLSRYLERCVGVDDDLADLLLASIDQEITSAAPKRRVLLLRDKVMFIAGRCLHLTILQLLTLKIDDFSERVERFSFFHGVRTAEDVTLMLCWYRRSLWSGSNHPATKALFLSYVGRPLRDSEVGARFKRAVHAAALHRSISGWAQWADVSRRLSISSSANV